MCLNKEGFDTYVDKDEGEVMMVDKSTCKVFLDVITLKIGMHDDIVMSIGKVRYIPSLRKNHSALE